MKSLLKAIDTIDAAAISSQLGFNPANST